MNLASKRVIEMPDGKARARVDILGFKVRHLFEYLLLREAVRQEIEDIHHPDTHSADSGSPPALLRVNRNTLR